MAEFNPMGLISDGLGLGGGGVSTLIYAIIIALGVIFVCGTLIMWIYNIKKWNLKVEFKLPRAVKYYKEGGALDPDDVSGFVDWEWGKGMYNQKNGVVWLKRKGKPKYAMKPFNIARYLQGKNLLTVIQVGSNDFMPVIPESYLIYQDEQGSDASLLNVKADTAESRAWKNSFERDAKKAYSIMGLLERYYPMIAIGLVIFLWGIQFILIYNRLK